MPLVRLPEPFDHPDWIFEVKYDGFRSLAYVLGGEARLVSRRGKPYKAFRDLCAWIGTHLPVRDAILDGEIVCLDSTGKPVFNDLLYRRGTPHFYAFDLVWLNGRDLRDRPLLSRKEALRELVPPQPASVLYAGHVERRGVDLFNAACREDLEGVVAKWKDGRYRVVDGLTSWIKIKNRRYSQVEGRRERFERWAVGASASRS